MLKRCNSPLDADVCHVAMLYATSNFISDELHQANEILQDLRLGSFGIAKQKGDNFTRPEFGSGLDYFRRKQFTALVSKVPFKGSMKQRKLTAIDSFMAAEKRCARTNKRLQFYSRHVDRLPNNIRVLLTRARENCRRILGPLNDSSLRRILSDSRPGGGVAEGTRNRFRVSLPYKLGDTDLSVTERALPWARSMMRRMPKWSQLHADINWASLSYTLPFVSASGNRITFVPKDARSLRTIAIEPALNVALQLGVHSHLVRRLRLFGNDITDQSRNQGLARYGSLNGFSPQGLSTIDLSSASDSLSTELIRWLLPWDWFLLLDDLRCHSGIIEGSPILYEKFSSMGNGFTFGLETLVFYSLILACESLVQKSDGIPLASCYGDDIILSTSATALAFELLKFCGFEVNPSKTFTIGSFRESCGADWHSGFRVTPQYIRKSKLRPTDVYGFLNRVDPVFNWDPIRSYLIRSIKASGQEVLYGLENEDTNSCLFASFDFVKGQKRLFWCNALQTYRFRVIKFTPKKESLPPDFAYASCLFPMGSVERLAYLESHVAKAGRGDLRGRGSFSFRLATPGITLDVPRFI